MRLQRRKSSMEKICLLVSMATLIVMVMATKVKVDESQIQSQGQHENQHENKNKNETEDSAKMEISVNETAGNLTLDLDFNLGDLAFERAKTKHELIIIKDYFYHGPVRNVECRGENIKSLGAISCDSMESCEENKSNLFDQKKCRRRWSSDCVRECDESGRDFYYRPYSCLQLDISFHSGSSGMIQCTSEEDGVNVTSFDHYTIGYYNASLLSTLKNKTASDLSKMKLYVTSLTAPVNADFDLSQNDEKKVSVDVTLFVDEEVTVFECKVPKLLFHKDQVIFRIYKKDGSVEEQDSKISTTSRTDGFMKADLTFYRVSKDVVAFACSVQKTNASGQWLENRINITVQDLPSKVMVKMSESRNMTVDLTSGAKVNLECQLNGPLEVKSSIKNQIRKMRDKFFAESRSKSVIEFLRFYQVAGEHLTCEEVDSDKNNSAAGHQRHYGYLQNFRFIFNLAPSAPKIHRNNPSSSVPLIYHEDHVVDQTLLCLFNGEPQPVITWMKNGQKFLSEKSMGTFIRGNETLEHVKLRLDPKTIQPRDFKPIQIGSAKGGHANFSCNASNFFGSDRLDFIISLTGDFPHPSENSNPETTTTEKSTTSTTTETTKILPSPTTTTSTSTVQTREAQNLDSSSNSTLNLEKRGAAEKSKLFLIVTGVFALSFICILGFSILWKKRAAFARAVENRRIFTFQNLVQNGRSESMRNVLAD